MSNFLISGIIDGFNLMEQPGKYQVGPQRSFGKGFQLPLLLKRTPFYLPCGSCKKAFPSTPPIKKKKKGYEESHCRFAFGW